MQEADDEELVVLATVPFEVQTAIAKLLLPGEAVVAAPSTWAPVLRLSSTCRAMSAAVLEAVCETVPVLRGTGLERSAHLLGSMVGSLMQGGAAARWKPVRCLRAVRAQTAHAAPMQAAPRLAGASLCAVSSNALCLFGGRESVSGDTLGTTCLIKLSQGVAIWDSLRVEGEHPSARCYHSAAIWSGGAMHRQRPSSGEAGRLPPMIVFGGAGEGDEGNENLLSDVWSATMAPAAADGARGGGRAPPLRWRELHPTGVAPVARSSHICTAWPAQRSLVVHGGLSVDGVLGDVWILREASVGRGGSGRSGGGGGGGAVGSGDGECEWAELHTSGAAVQRAHHCGGLVGDSTLLVFSGQVSARTQFVDGTHRGMERTAGWNAPRDGA